MSHVRRSARYFTTQKQKDHEMRDGDTEDEVLRFIFENIDTVPHLEALLLVWQNSATPWSTETLAARLYVSSAQANTILEDLSRRGFVTQEHEGAAYRYAPDWDAQRGLMPRIAETYRRNLVGITRMIHSKGSASVREFARAFQIKKDS
jgi:predicted ArsR family transcriptional regulator